MDAQQSANPSEYEPPAVTAETPVASPLIAAALLSVNLVKSD